MRFSTALSVISATGALASNMAMADAPSSGYALVESSTMIHETAASPVMMHDATPTTMMHEITSTAMMHETTSAAMMHETTSAAMMHETTSAAMMHETVSAAVMHDVMSAASGYTASVSPPMAHEGPMTHTVVVGGAAGLVYTPSEVKAAVGDTIMFTFMSQNHTVTQSTFPKPCNKLSVDAPDSGFMSNPNNTVVPAPTWEYTVTSMDPTWWYCKQRTGGHCGKGMVFAINPTNDKNFDTFKMAAISINGTAVATGTTAAAVITTPVGTVTLIAGGGSSAAATGTALVTSEAATGTALVTSEAATATTLVTDSAIASPEPVAPIAAGWNEGGASCQCACFCGVSAYPPGDGVGSYGGYSGAMVAPW